MEEKEERRAPPSHVIEQRGKKNKFEHSGRGMESNGRTSGHRTRDGNGNGKVHGMHTDSHAHTNNNNNNNNNII